MDHDPLSRRLGGRLRQIRQHRNLTLTELSQLTGVSKPMLGQIERGVSSPTVATLWKIASGLNVPFTALLDERLTSQIVRSDAQSAVFEDNRRFQVFSTYAPPGGALELYRIRLLPGCKRKAEPHQPGIVEAITVFAGSLHITVQDEVVDLFPGDSLNFSGDLPHIYENVTDTDCHAHMAILYTRASNR